MAIQQRSKDLRDLRSLISQQATLAAQEGQLQGQMDRLQERLDRVKRHQLLTEDRIKEAAGSLKPDIDSEVDRPPRPGRGGPP